MAERWQSEQGFDIGAVRLTQHLEDAPKGHDAADLDRAELTAHLDRLQIPTLPRPPLLQTLHKLFCECCEDLGYDAETRAWMVWNDGYWKAEAWSGQPTVQLFHDFRPWLSKRSLDIQQRCDRLTKETPDKAIDATRKEWQDYSKDLWSPYWPQGNVTTDLKTGAIRQLSGPTYGQLPVAWMNLRNGILDLEEGRLRAHEESKQGQARAVSMIDLELPGNMASGKELGPQYEFWMSTLSDLLDNDTMRYLQITMGAALGGAIRRRYLWLYGPGRTGKNTFLEAIKAALGPLYTVLEKADVEANHRGGANHNGSLKDCIKNQCSISQLPGEAEKLRINIPWFKGWSGGDFMRVRGSGDLHGQHVEGMNVSLPVLVSNAMPNLALDDALLERQQIIPFTRQQPMGQDWRLNQWEPRLLDSGFRQTVLGWLVRGYYEFRKYGEPDPSEAMLRASRQAERAQDPIFHWLRHEGKEYAGMTAKELCNRANEELEDELHNELTPAVLGRHLARSGWVQRRTGARGSRIWQPA